MRELRNILERAAILCDGGLITADHLARTVAPASSAPISREAAPTAAPLSSGPLPQDLNAAERAMIEEALKLARFNKSKAAKALGLTRHQLYVWMRKHGFD